MHSVLWAEIKPGFSVAYLTYMSGPEDYDHVIEVARWVPERPENEDFVIEVPVTSVCYFADDACAFYLELMDDQEEVVAHANRVLFLE